MHTTESLKIFILEDEFVIAQDIFEIISSIGFSSIKIANTYQQAQKICKQWKPDLILCDINLEQEKTGIDFIKYLQEKHNNFETIFISALSDEQTLEQAKFTFPLNYLVKPFSEKQIEITLQLALNAINTKQKRNIPSLKKLSHTEIKILQLIAIGYKSIDIAEKLFVAEKTIRNHRYNISKKLQLPSEKNNLLKWAITHFS